MPPEKRRNIICKNEADFEKIFLPATHEKKMRKQAMEDPKKFGEHLEKELRRRIKAK